MHMPGSVGGVSMEHIVWDKVSQFYKLGQSMDKIGGSSFHGRNDLVRSAGNSGGMC